jgi:uncharacterized membrane protein
MLTDLYSNLQILLRWIHVIAGIAWVGHLYFFNFVNVPLQGALGADVKKAVNPAMLGRALWWFRWSAMVTFVAGLVLFTQLYMYQPGVGFGPSELWRGPDGVTGRALWISLGMFLGFSMWANVWFVIWPAQQVVIASAEKVAGGGEAIPEAASRGARAGLASRTNTLFSIPMLFFMGAASHLTFLHNGDNDLIYWVIALALIVAFEVNALSGTGQPRQKYLSTVSGTIHAGLALTLVLYLVGAIIN